MSSRVKCCGFCRNAGGCGGGGDEVGKFLHTIIRGGIEETKIEMKLKIEVIIPAFSLEN